MTAPRQTAALVVRSFNSQVNGLDLRALAREAGIHPDVARRFVHLGLLEPVDGTPGLPPRYPRDAAATLARAMRLSRDLGLNYAGAVLACQLLARIAQLEARLARVTKQPID